MTIVHTNCYKTEFKSWVEVPSFYVLPVGLAREVLYASVGQTTEGKWQLELACGHQSQSTQTFYGSSAKEVNDLALERCRYWHQFVNGELTDLDTDKPYLVRKAYPDGYRTECREGVVKTGRYRLSSRNHGNREEVGQWQLSWGDDSKARGYGCGWIPVERIAYQGQTFTA